ncbi:acetate kinase [Thiotrichales bacterium 19S11-10]|nr:acetate kinase [Thiotrichales bacterium 19S11-10]
MSEFVLTLNCGSSSVKFALISPKTEKAIISGQAESILSDACSLSYQGINLKKSKTAYPNAHYEDIFKAIKTLLDQEKLTESIIAIGHRVVHGGNLFKKATLIDQTVVEKIQSLNPLAPLHNPHNLSGIIFCQKIFPDIKQVAVFDTAFHQSIPITQHLYAIPYDLYENQHIRKYGFHGISHQYLSQKADEILKKSKGNYISLHLGNGCSITAIKDGKSFDTSMGFTPLDGLVMGTRSGSIDPSILIFLSNQMDMTTDEIDKLLNKSSGLLGLTGHSDMRQIEELAKQNNSNAKLALDIFSQRIAFYVSAYYAYFDKIDAIIFSGGIGENSVMIRELVIEKIKNLGYLINHDHNKTHGHNTNYQISQSNTPNILVIPTNEELMIANEALALVND